MITLFEESPPVKIPPLFFHGTNILSACAILHDGLLQAEDPSDHDGEYVVCVSAARKVARVFAVEFSRHNSRLDVGAVFVLDGARICEDYHPAPFRSETAGALDEQEFRVQDDITLNKYCLGIRLVGKTKLLRSGRVLEQLWEDDGQPHGTFAEFRKLVDKLIELSKAPINPPGQPIPIERNY